MLFFCSSLQMVFAQLLAQSLCMCDLQLMSTNRDSIIILMPAKGTVKCKVTNFRPVPIFVLLTWNWFVWTNFCTFEVLKTNNKIIFMGLKPKRNFYSVLVKVRKWVPDENLWLYCSSYAQQRVLQSVKIQIFVRYPFLYFWLETKNHWPCIHRCSTPSKAPNPQTPLASVYKWNCFVRTNFRTLDCLKKNDGEIQRRQSNKKFHVVLFRKYEKMCWRSLWLYRNEKKRKERKTHAHVQTHTHTHLVDTCHSVIFE